MGEDSPYPRYLDDPYLHGGADNFFSTNGQAHHDSGVSSLAFYLMAEGGEHPRANTVDVQPIGIADATDILYDALINYYVPYESFQNASYAQMLAAYDNLGYEGVVSVAAAWKAVGVDFYFWGLPGAVDPTYQLSYMGWVTYDIDFQYFWLDSGTIFTIIMITLRVECRFDVRTPITGFGLPRKSFLCIGVIPIQVGAILMEPLTFKVF